MLIFMNNVGERKKTKTKPSSINFAVIITVIITIVVSILGADHSLQSKYVV